MNRWSALVFAAIIGIALALRVPNLPARPLHNDEAVNAIKVTELWQTGRYRYDPDEYHGPTLHYFTLPILWLSGAKNANDLPDAALRVAPLIFGVALILLLPLFSDGIDRRALAWAGLFIAISPAMVFYSRYFIHEMLLVFFSALTLGAGWRYTQTKHPAWMALAGGGVGLMFATKETFVITLAAMIGALAAGGLRKERLVSLIPPRRDLLLGISAVAVVWLLFFSSFFTNIGGLLDSIRTYFPWLKRAGGQSPHIHSWSFYFQRLAWFHPVKGPIFSEALILFLAALGGIVSFRNKAPLPRFLTIFTLLLTAAYTVISYKTPWCLMNFYFGMILLAGMGANAWIEASKHRIVKTATTIVLLALCGQLAFQAVNASQSYAADRRNPYVYAQTVPNLFELVSQVEALAKIAPGGFQTPVKVIAPDADYWPLPWYLRRFTQIGWYDKMPDDPFAPVVIVAADLEARLDERSEKKWVMTGYTELRPKKFLECYVELELWKKYVATLPRNPDSE